MKKASNVIPFYVKEKSHHTINLKVGECVIYGIPFDHSMTVENFTVLNEIVQYAQTNNIKNIWFHKFQYTSHVNYPNLNEKEVIQYVEEKWLKTYPVWRFNNAVSQVFLNKLSELPVMYQKLIKEKYLTFNQDGKLPINDIVCGTLNISERQFYRVRKEALYQLRCVLLHEGIIKI